jgi:hypothetical protein
MIATYAFNEPGSPRLTERSEVVDDVGAVTRADIGFLAEATANFWTGSTPVIENSEPNCRNGWFAAVGRPTLYSCLTFRSLRNFTPIGWAMSVASAVRLCLSRQAAN